MDSLWLASPTARREEVCCTATGGDDTLTLSCNCDPSRDIPRSSRGDAPGGGPRFGTATSKPPKGSLAFPLRISLAIASRSERELFLSMAASSRLVILLPWETLPHTETGDSGVHE